MGGLTKKERTLLFFYQNHLYKNKLEMFLKMVIWWISWIGGVAAVDLTVNNSIKPYASASLLFSISILIEFVPKIDERVSVLQKIIHLIFCGMPSVIFILSFAILFDVDIPCFTNISCIFSLIILIYITVDFSLLWILPDIPIPNEDYMKVNTQNQSNSFCDEITVFEKNLTAGNLGNIKGGG